MHPQRLSASGLGEDAPSGTTACIATAPEQSSSILQSCAHHPAAPKHACIYTNLSKLMALCYFTSGFNSSLSHTPSTSQTLQAVHSWLQMGLNQLPARYGPAAVCGSSWRQKKWSKLVLEKCPGTSPLGSSLTTLPCFLCTLSAAAGWTAAATIAVATA